MYPGADCEKTQAPIGNAGLAAELKAFHAERFADSCPQRPMSSEEVVAEFFKYHAPNERTIPKYAAINQAAKNFAEVILANCPAGHDRTGAINCIRMARMTANAAIALNGLSLY
jgi:hypothetical protein